MKHPGTVGPADPLGAGLGQAGNCSPEVEESCLQTSRTGPAASSLYRRDLAACVLLQRASADVMQGERLWCGLSEQEEPREGAGGCPGLECDRAGGQSSVGAQREAPGRHCTAGTGATHHK